MVAVLTLGAVVARAGISGPAGGADFGTVYEADGPKSVRIYVTNTGTEPTAILKIRPTCGCTAADFQPEPFAPGDSAWIDLTYDPAGRAGRFEKAVKVYPLDGEMIRIPVTGIVRPSEAGLAAKFPVAGGLLLLSEQTLMTLSPLGNGERSLYIDAYNAGSRPVSLRVESDDEAVEVQPMPPVLMPDEQGMIGIYIRPDREKRTGRLEYTLRLYTSDEATPEQSTEIKVYTEK